MTKKFYDHCMAEQVTPCLYSAPAQELPSAEELDALLKTGQAEGYNPATRHPVDAFLISFMQAAGDPPQTILDKARARACQVLLGEPFPEDGSGGFVWSSRALPHPGQEEH